MQPTPPSSMHRASGTPFPGPLGNNGSQPVFDLISREELKRLAHDQGLTDAQIAKMYNVSTNQVHRKREQMNLIHGQRTSDALAHIVRLAEAVKSLPDEAIAEVQAIVSRYTGFQPH